MKMEWGGLAQVRGVREQPRAVDENFDNLKSQCFSRWQILINEGWLVSDCDHKHQADIIQELEQVKQKKRRCRAKKGLISKDLVKQAPDAVPTFQILWLCGGILRWA